MTTYKIITPTDYTREHIDYIEQFKNSMNMLAKQTNLMMIVKDVNSVFITGTDLSASKFGLKSGKEFSGKSIADVPCPSAAACASEINIQELELINSFDINKKMEILHVFDFADGLKARLGIKSLLFHEQTNSVLGIVGLASNVELKDFINIIPDYILRFGSIGTIESMSLANKEGENLNEYEQEICFLILLNWSFAQIAEFMNVFRPTDTIRNADTIIKKKNYICQKLHLPGTHVKDLCEYLFATGFHKKLPSTFYSRIIGTKVVN